MYFNILESAFPADRLQEREALQQTLREAITSDNLPTVHAAQEKLCVWLQAHPDDYALWEAGEPLAMLADALQTRTVNSEPDHAL